MLVEYINPFLEAAGEILRTVAHLEIERGIPSVAEVPFEVQEVTVVLGVVGDMVGQVVYGLSLESAVAIAGRMMGRTDLEDLDEFAKSAVAELGNMITGNAASRFERMAVQLEISPPTVLTGQGMSLSWPMDRALVVPLHSEAGDLVVWVGLAARKGEVGNGTAAD